MSEGCDACGARAVGPPLVRPARELPSYGRAFFSVTAGLLLALAFAGAWISALLQRENFSFEPRALLAGAEAAAWRLKWLGLPFALAASWFGARACARIRREPSRFTGLGAARGSLLLTAVTGLILAALVGVTIPERLRLRETARRAADEATLYAGDRALFVYRARFGTYPASVSDLHRLDDPDCSIAKAVASMESGKYAPETDLASLSAGRTKRRGARRPSAVRNASARSTDDLHGGGLSLTNYDLVLPGRDKILGTDDDLRIRDGVVTKPAPPDGRTTPTPLR